MSTITLPDFVGCDTGGAGGTTDDEARKIIALQHLFNVAYTTSYSELTYDVQGDLEKIDVWDTAAKVTKLFTRTLGYSAPPKDLLTVTTVDEVAVCTLTTTLTYSGNDIATVTKAIT